MLTPDEEISTREATLRIYPLSRYTFDFNGEWKRLKHASFAHRLDRMKRKFVEEGLRKTVEGVLLVHAHNHPHLLILRAADTFCQLPGGRLKPGEDEIEGLKRKLTSKLAPTLQPDWQIGECVAMWWRPNFDRNIYPYCPPHITKPKECKKLFLVHMSEHDYFTVSRNVRLRAVPFFELYDNVQIRNSYICHPSSAVQVSVQNDQSLDRQGTS